MKLLKKLFILISLSLCSCTNTHNERGYVIEKNHRDAYNTVQFIHVYNGKTTMLIPYTIHHHETWSLDLRDENEGKYKNYTVYLKDSSVWEEIQIGDYFVWDEDTCFDCEPTTRTRGNV